ncbi:MAG TPA: PP2C family protein-serine/threonine phosphatase [Terracidiphilus sp.]|nr:PP2C family protein-serine/threonine phosphatase [Terracidiphilus sp.]
MIRRCCVLLAFLLFALTLPAPGQQLDASAAGTLVSLDAPWRIHFGDDPAFAQPGFDDSRWMLHDITKDWASEGHKGYAGYAWYRIRVILPKGNEPLDLAIYPPANATEVYIDGTLAGTIGRMRPEPVWTLLRDVYAIRVPSALNGRSVDVALRVWEDPLAASYLGAGAASHPPLVGTAADLERIVSLEQQNRWIAAMSDRAADMLCFAVGLFSLGLFLLDRRAREYAYAAVFFCGYGATFLYSWISAQTGTSVRIAAQVAYTSNSILLCLWLLFTWGFVRARTDRLLYTCLAASSVEAIAATLTTLGITHVGVAYWIDAGMYLFLAFAVSARLYTLARRGNRDAQMFLVPFSLWTMTYCIQAIIWALYSSGIVNLGSANILYHNGRFTILWSHIFTVLFFIAVGAVLVLRYADTAKQEQRLRTEMESARRVQNQLVPADLPQLAAFACDAAYRAASEVGGDFYQVFPRSDGSALILVGDVSGKGLRAAMLGTLIVGGAGTLAQENIGPAEMLERLNRHLHGRTDGGFATCLCALLAADGELAIANAGHLAPYSDGREVACESGLPLGIVPEANYIETRVQLVPGDSLTFLSDGVVEARTATGEIFGFDRTREISGQTAAQIAETAARFGQEDDITVLTVTLSPVAAMA